MRRKTAELKAKSVLMLLVVVPRYLHVPVDPDDLPIKPGLKPPYPYKTIGCLFNHESFFANSQVHITSIQ